MAKSKYRLPTDKRILVAMADGRRQTSTNLAVKLDLDRRYVSSRLKFLREKGYLYDSGPADQSRMVELSTMGRIALFHKEKLIRDYTTEFEHLCYHIYACNRDMEEQFFPDLVATRYEEHETLKELADVNGLTIPSELDGSLHDNHNARRSLYSLYFWDLAERKEEMDVYEVTSRGRKLLLSLQGKDAFTPQAFGDNQLSEWIKNTKAIREDYSKEEWDRLDKLTQRLPEDEPSDVRSVG